jgi:uncharacterized iron-regulated protein
MLRVLIVLCLMGVGACAPIVPSPPPDILILGEQHDAPAHQRLHRELIERLIHRGQLAGVALEMAVAGHSTAALPRDATEPQARLALDWDEAGWPWEPYVPIVMAAVRAGVPVAGANLSREALKSAAADGAIDSTVSREVMQAQQENVRDGHCGLLPEAQWLPLARMQVARDRSLARAVVALAQPGKAAVLVSGAQHADARLAVPLHLPKSLRSESRLWPPEPPREDYCEKLRKQFGKKADASQGQ